MLEPEISRRHFLQGTVALYAASGFKRAFGSGPTGELELRCEYLSEALGVHEDRPLLSWRPNNLPSTAQEQAAFRLTVFSSMDRAAQLWDSGRTESSAASALYGGPALATHQQAFWSVQTWYRDGSTFRSPLARWSKGPVTESDWVSSRWIAHDDILENTEERMPGSPGAPPLPASFPAPLLRKDFATKQSCRSALLYVAAPGFAEVWLNGERIDASLERSPGFTNFEERVEYAVFDVSSRVRAGANTLGVLLGTGWYDVHDVATWHFNTAGWRQRPCLRALLIMRGEDGSESAIVSDETWRSKSGPLLRDGIYTGEIYDARLELTGWSSPGYDAADWGGVLSVRGPRGKLVPVNSPPVRICDTLTPVGISQPRPGVWMVDMGQTFSGHVQLRLQGPRGQAVTMRYGEVLHPDGTLNTAPIDKFMMKTTPPQPFQQDTYVCKGGEVDEVWEQRFSYAGLRYAEVTNFPGTPTIANFRGRFCHADLNKRATFKSSSEVANAIQHATVWSFLSNAQSHPTDCPQREKNGWTGDAGLAVDTGLINFESEAFYRKWLRDISDAQRRDGGLPVIVPTSGWGDGRSWPGDICPPWDAAYLIIVWKLFCSTGDKRVLMEHADGLRKYVAFFLAKRKADGLVPGLGLGDWLPWKTVTPLDYISNAYLYLCLDLMAQVDAILELPSAHGFAAQKAELATKMQQRYFAAETNQFSNGSQTAQALALQFGFVPASAREGVFARLSQDVERTGHIDAGILGAKFVPRALAAGGRCDLGFRLFTQTELPGWGHWIKQGATTLWEDWNGELSRNHIMFGDVSAWFFECLLGMQQGESSTAFDTIVLRPQPIAALEHVAGSIVTPRGLLRSAWVRQGTGFELRMEVPIGKPAQLMLPDGFVLKDRKHRGERQLALRPGTHTLLLVRQS